MKTKPTHSEKHYNHRRTFRFFALLSCFFLFQTLTAQHISVESFTMLPNDMDARVTYPKNDPDGRPSAIVKVVTTETGFSWDVGMVGVVDAVRRTGEYWLYLRQGTQRITISHDRLGVLRNYVFPIPIEAATVYEMRLVTGRVETTVVPAELESQWLLITAEPNTALIYLDGVLEATGVLQKRLLPGSYTYRIENNLYHTEAGRITVTAEQRAELNVTLKPNFGFIEVKSTPETGAQVRIDGKDAGFSTNGTSEQLESGEYTVTVIKEQFQPASRQVTVRDNQTTAVTLDMAPNFANVEVNLPADATLFINNERRRSGNWSGRLNAGVYTFEARKDKHRPAKQDMQLQAGDARSIALEPQPITGSLDVVSMPPQATIKLNGKDYGTTPTTIRELLIGEYTITLERQGYARVTKSITVTEGGSAMVNETLPAGMQVSITSEPAGAELYIDNQKAGTTPYTGQLGFGSHTLKLINNTKTVEETITIAQGGRTSFTFDVSETKDFTETTANLNLEMVFVKGGTFTMGCTEEQGSDCWDDEKPTRRVTVSDFYIGRYEVTQKQWRAVMGASTTLSDPSYFKGCDNCPVERVSWNDIQEFIKKLNQLTGKKYRLPTEAEWEFAARGGTQSRGFKYAGNNNIDEVAWYRDNSTTSGHTIREDGRGTFPVGGKKPNELGLYDMSGNVWEWCEDDWHSNYRGAPNDGRAWVDSPRGSHRVLRGGSWYNYALSCRVSHRNDYTPDSRSFSIGFRLAQSP